MGSSVLPKEMLLRQLVRLVRLHEEQISIELCPKGLSGRVPGGGVGLSVAELTGRALTK
jgi:hypothetical protein